jgi:sn-glycerol 3-phosphate transport system ATP-binding protein
MEVFERPADTYVAGFIGAPAMNFLPAVLADQGTAARLDAGPLVRFVDGCRAGADGRTLTLGIRPEHLTVGDAQFAVQVDLIEPLGSETLIHGHLTTPDETAIVVKVNGRAPVGEIVPVGIQPEFLHVFDRETGLRIDPVG